MPSLIKLIFGTAILLLMPNFVRAQSSASQDCRRPTVGSTILEPKDLRSRNGVLKVELTFRKSSEPNGNTRFCYIAPDGSEAPTLRVNPGDLLILTLKNDIPASSKPAAPAMVMGPKGAASTESCASREMTVDSTNVHFHGLSIPPVCHQDDVLNTSIEPSDQPFEYRFRIPKDQPPGLYWYHPHIHGVTKPQVLGGASGALIVEEIERANKAVAGLPERVLIIRDQNLMNPNAPPSKSEPVLPKMLIDRDGDAANNGTGFGQPAKDLSINFVPVPYPDYPPATIPMRPAERQLWRILNASAITYLNLALVSGHAPQQLGIVAVDGVPFGDNGSPAPRIEWRDHAGLPPGGRVEFIVTAPAPGASALFVTRTVDTGLGGENDPNRPLATVIAAS